MLPDIRRLSSLRYVPGLDGVRAIAVTSVMLFHYTAWFTPALAPLGAGWDAWTRVAKLGWMGVDVFFVLSGFLITRVLEVHPLHGWRDYGGFLARRAWRLLPAYVACLLVFVAIAALWAPEAKTFRNQWLLWTFTGNIEAAFGDRAAFVDARFAFVHFWSLAVEWHFYLLFPWLLRGLGSAPRAGVALIVVALATRAALWALGASDNATYGFTFSRVDAFGMGCLVAAWRTPLSAAQARGALAAAALVGGGVCVALMATPRPFKVLDWMQLWGYTAIAAAAALALAAIVHGPRDGRVVRALENRGLAAWGRVSYSAYLWHMVFFPATAAFVIRQVADPRAQFLGAAGLSIAFTAAAAITSYRLLEVRFLARRPAAPAPA